MVIPCSLDVSQLVDEMVNNCDDQCSLVSTANALMKSSSPMAYISTSVA